MYDRVVLTLLLLSVGWGGAWAGNTHTGTGDVTMEFRAWWGDAGNGYVASGCLHATSGTTSAAIASCRAYALTTTTPRQLEYIEELSSRTITYSGGDGTYWLIAHASTTEPVSGWTRVGVSHYLWQKSTTQPVLPSQGVWLARVTVASSDITVVTDWRSSNPMAPNLLRVTDPLWGATINDGTNDAVGLQAALTACQRGNVVVEFPAGIYDANGDNLLAIQGVWGTQTSLAVWGASNCTVRGYGAILRQGATSVRLFGVYDSTHIKIEGLHWIGHTQTISQHKHAIVIGHNSSHVEITRNYFTNFLGECVNIGGNMSNGALTGYESQHVWIHHNTCKERVGNGTSSVSGGTKSRLAMAIEDARYVTIESNLIYGVIDIEPNVNSQWAYHLYIKNNMFHSGPVTPQSSIGTTYHFEEPLLAPGAGGTVIDGGIVFTGVAATPTVGEVYFDGNTFERGSIICTVSLYVCGITNNTFNEGLIAVGQTSGPGVITFTDVRNNATKFPYPGATTFVRLDGLVTFGTFINNVASIPGGYVIDEQTAVTGEGGRNLYLGNSNRSATAAGALGFTVHATSVAGDQYFNQNAAGEHLTTRREAFSSSINLVPTASPPANPGTGEMYTDSSGALCWFNGSAWVVVAGGGTCS